MATLSTLHHWLLQALLSSFFQMFFLRSSLWATMVNHYELLQVVVSYCMLLCATCCMLLWKPSNINPSPFALLFILLLWAVVVWFVPSSLHVRFLERLNLGHQPQGFLFCFFFFFSNLGFLPFVAFFFVPCF
jgi:hypothetical protein